MPRLLIVDDETDVREFARNFFRKRGIEVFTAASGPDALELIGREQPDLVLLDVRMAGMTGVDVLRELRQRGQQVKVIMVSGVEDVQIVEETKGLGAIGFIHKPLVLEELEKVVLQELNPSA